MKSSAPWSVKGIRRDARETAKEAAKRHGMTVGEWLSQVIYAAGDPESSDGEIEGIKTSDLVTAIEHLNKRVIGAESRSAEAMEDLARKIGGSVERLQRLERTRPSEGSPSIEERLQKLEARAGDRQRIDALRALEKAVGQVALQYDSAHKSTLARLDSTERQLQELASRIDSAGEKAGGEPAGIAALKQTVAGLSQRLERAEQVAAEAARMREEAGESIDAEFVERTGARLRILGDEIKRGGDQIRTLESLIKKLSDQIDAAERRSSEGVQKVAETISQLRSQFGQPESQSEEIEAAMAEVTRRTETRIAELQRSFESMIARLDAPAGDVRETGKPPADALDGDESSPADPSADREDPSGDSDRFAALDVESDIDAIFGDDGDKTDKTEDEEAAFSFDAGDDASADEEKDDALTDVVDAPGADPLGADVEAPDEAHAKAATPSPTSASDAEFYDPLVALIADRDEDAGDADSAYLRETRRAVRETTERSADAQARRRQLTPKQRALLAAKIRRKRLAEQGLTLAAEPPAEAPAIAARESDEDEDRATGATSMMARAASALTALRPRRQDEAAATDTAGAGTLAGETDTQTDGAPNFTRAVRAALARVGVRPVTLALGAAILLAAAALVFLVRDIVYGGAQNRVDAPTPAPSTQTSETAPAEPQSESASVPAAPSEPLTQPRVLYLESVAELETAKTDAQTREALKTLQQAAALGHPPAQLQLGELYKLGQGIAQDPAQARIWYERAAQGGNVLAMHRAGVMAARGQGGPTDLAAAIAWFEKAANYGLVDSQYNLGATYHPANRGGSNPAQDVAKAYYWYGLAAINGDEQAKTLAAGLAASLSPDERRVLDERISEWVAEPPDPSANEVAPAS